MAVWEVIKKADPHVPIFVSSKCFIETTDFIHTGALMEDTKQRYLVTHKQILKSEIT